MLLEPPSGLDRGTRLLEAAAVLVALLATLPGQHDRQLWAPDELREAGISRAMARTGDSITPRLNGKPFLEKPPLFHAVQAAIFQLTGSGSRFTARLPAVLFALATLGATWLLARRLGGRRWGALSALTLATTAGFWSASHGATTDDAVPPFVTLAFYFLLRAREPRSTLWPWLGAGFAAGLAFLAKGAPGPAIIFAGAFAWLVLERDFRIFRSPGVAVAALGLLVPAALWIGALYLREGASAVQEVLLQNLRRAASGSADHGNPFWYYLEEMPLFFLPWTPVLIGGAIAAAWRWRRAPEGRLGSMGLPAAWLLAGLFILSLASAKRRVYLLPLAPAGAILTARLLEALLFEGRPAAIARWAPIALAAAAVLGLMGASIYDGGIRPEDLPVALAGGATAAMGVIAVALLAGKVERLAALAFVLAALAFVIGDRGAAPREDERRGFEFLREIWGEIGDRRTVLYRPREGESQSEGLRGALSYYFDRDFPEAIGAEGLAAAREAAAGQDFAVVSIGCQGDVERVLGAGRIALRRRVLRAEVAVAIYGASR